MILRHAPLPTLLMGTALLLSACHPAKKPSGNSLDAIDNELVEGTPTGGANDLGAAIRVDPRRAGRHAGASSGAPVAYEEAAQGDCLARNRDHLAYGDAWAGKLPADLPIHPKAKLAEAAGHSGDCEVRVASFTVPDAPEAVLAWYEDRAHRGGWDAGRTTRDGEVWLAGTKGDAAFTVMTQPKGPATAVDYVWVSGN